MLACVKPNVHNTGGMREQVDREARAKGLAEQTWSEDGVAGLTQAKVCCRIAETEDCNQD